MNFKNLSSPIKVVVFTSFLMSFSFLSFAQNTITGKLFEETNIAADFCKISLVKSGDSLVFKSTLSDENGSFEFADVEEGMYKISVNREGCKSFESLDFQVNLRIKELGEITLVKDVKIANEVSIVVKKPAVTVSAEKVILNVSNMSNLVGLNAFEVLRRTPGVVIDKDNNITLKGKSDVMVFMDGRPSQMSKEALVNLLKGMNAADIESIEVIKNPSAKYDAAGTGGIINILLKKNKGYGNNVGIELGGIYSLTPKYNGSVSFNHRDKRFNVFSNFSTSGGDWQNYMDLYRLQDGIVYDQKMIDNSLMKNHNFKLGADYFLNNKHTFGINVTGNTSASDSKIDMNTAIIEESSSEIQEVLLSNNESQNSLLNYNVNSNYRFKDTLGNKFSTDFDFGNFSNRLNVYQPNIYYNADQTAVLEENNYGNSAPTDIQTITLKSDFEKTIKKNTWGLGYKISNVETDNTFDFFNVENTISTKDLTRSNTFHYSETVYAGYLNYSGTYKRFGLQAGIRYENTHSIGTLKSEVTNTEPVDRKYGNFFPSSALTYEINPKHTLMLTYSKRIDRPSYQDLNPFENKISELAYEKGNAFLKPQYSNSIEFSHVFMEFLTTSFGYTKTVDFISDIVDTANSTASFITLTNLDYVTTTSFNISSPIPITKWWNGFLNLNLSQNTFYARFDDGKEVNLQNFAYNVYLSNSFSLKKDWSIELSGWYSSPTINTGTFIGEKMYSIDFGLKKKVLKGKGDFTLNFSDLFRTQIWAGTSNYAGVLTIASGGYESRQVRLNFSCRFGNSGLKSEQRNTGSEEEKDRIKTK